MVQTSSGLLWKLHLGHIHARVEISAPEAEPHGEGKEEFPSFASSTNAEPVTTCDSQESVLTTNQKQLHHGVIHQETGNHLTGLTLSLDQGLLTLNLEGDC